MRRPAPADIGQAVTVYYRRLDPERGTHAYLEYLIDDDGARLRTQRVIPADYRAGVSAGLWRLGLLPAAQTLTSIRKHYFYGEPFDVLEFFDQDGGFAGYYSDITTPLTRSDGAYHLTDLFLDVWVTPDRQFHELDWDEFEAAAEQGLITGEQQALARATMARLRAEFATGVYPERYLDDRYRPSTTVNAGGGHGFHG